MCTRMTLKTPSDELADIFSANADALEGVDVLDYNIAPTDPVVAMRHKSHDDGTLERRLEPMRWGLIPHWAKDKKIGPRMLNARIETVAKKKAYRRPFRKKRCLVVADGFFEWLHRGDDRLPYWFYRGDARPMLIPGMWAVWWPDDAPEGADPLVSCTIVTRDAEGLVARVHDRMPAVLDEDFVDAWLDPEQENADELLDLVERHAALAGTELFRARAVDPWMNNVRHEGPRCIEPWDEGDTDVLALDGERERQADTDNREDAPQKELFPD